MTKNDMASVSKNDGGAAKTRLSGESPAGDVDALVERLTRLQQSGHCGESASEAIARGRYNETLTQAAEALTSLRTERDEAKSDLRVFLKSGITGADVNWCARAEAAEARALKAEAENKALREALKPFADAWRIAMEACPRNTLGAIKAIACHHVEAPHFRNARGALLAPSESQ